MDELRNYNQNVRKGKAGTTSKAYVTGKRQVGTIGSTGAFKKKQSIGDAFTSGIKSAGKKISDATGETDRKRAEAMGQLSGKLEKAANDVQRAYNDVVQSASEAIDAGKQFAKETANKVSIGVSELATKASDTVASGLAWVESIFAPKKKK